MAQANWNDIAHIRHWLTQAALPLWAGAGFDPHTHSFQERLTLQAEPMTDAPRRLMVQARQIYVYSTAQDLGWFDQGHQIAAQAAQQMIRQYYGADQQAGWVCAITFQGQIADATRDLYAHAFVLLGLAHAFRITGDKEFLVKADQTLAFLDTYMAHPAGGYRPCLPWPENDMRQNPHMHLFEGLLALGEVAPNGDYFERAAAVLDLFETKIFQQDTGIICEYFNDDWSPVPGDKGQLFEPGHHFEWAWLLYRYAQLTGNIPSHTANRITSMAGRTGHSPSRLLWEEVRDDGTPLTTEFRLWPLTEALKASLTPSGIRTGRQPVDWLRQLYTSFLKPAQPGGWHDRLNAEGECLSTFMPASSLYHIVCAMAEFDKLSRHD